MQWYERSDEKLRDYLPDMTVERDVPMSRHTSFRIGGPARRLAFPANREQLVILLGLDPTRILVMSQVLLSFGIALALVPLLIFTSNSQLMGDLVNTLWVKRTGWVIVGVVVLLNGWLLVGTIFGL